MNFTISQTLTFAWVNFFFSGFVAGLFFLLLASQTHYFFCVDHLLCSEQSAMPVVSESSYSYLTAKIPFPLTQRFRSMLQNGIDLSTVDVSYVSGRSWYVSYGILINYQPNLIDIFYNNHH